MIIYTCIMFGTALLFLVMGIAIYKGHTGLIHDYHRKNIPPSELPAYGREFSCGMFTITGTLLLSGMLSLAGEDGRCMTASAAVVFIGFGVSMIIFARVQKKYNGGFF